MTGSDIQEIVDRLRHDRQSMEDYRAVVAEQMVEVDHLWWLGNDTMLIYRKGNRFRVDTPHWFGGLCDYCMVEKPAEDADIEAWWRGRVGVFVYCPFYLSDDAAYHYIKMKLGADGAGQEKWQVGAVESHKTCGKPGDVFPPYYSRTPEFVCRPPMGLPSSHLESVLHTRPTIGPSGTVLLEVRRPGPMPTLSGVIHGEGLPPQPNVWRHWLDPQRGFAAVRWDMVIVSDSGEEKLIDSTIIEELAQSPSGIWYAKRMRNKAVPPVEHDTVYNFYLDFDASRPDSFFDLPKVGTTFEKQG